MKHFFHKTLVIATVFGTVITLSSFNNAKTEKKSSAVDAYTIDLISNTVTGTNQEWTWTVTNPNPGNGLNGTLQNVSHWDIPLSPSAEAALLSAEYSFDGITWISLSTEVDRDPAIKACTGTDVLKFNAGTIGDQPTYYRATFSQVFPINPYAISYIKGSTRYGCNVFCYAGLGATSQRMD